MMANTWSYDLTLGSKIPLSEKAFSIILDTADSFGYSVWAPGPKPTESPAILVMSHDGMDELEFHDIAAAQETLCGQGGLLTIWRALGSDQHLDIWITFEPGFGEISLSVGHGLHEDHEEDVQKARDLTGMFKTLCQRLEPIYGYSTDELTLEFDLGAEHFLKKWADFRTAVWQLKPPPILFWLNYFSSDYLHAIGERRLAAVPHRREKLEHGMFIYLAEDLWNSHSATLGCSGMYGA
jgi:hypothetical protein